MEGITVDQLHQMFYDRDWDVLAKILDAGEQQQQQQPVDPAGRSSLGCCEDKKKADEEQEGNENNRHGHGHAHGHQLKDLLLLPETSKYDASNSLQLASICSAPVNIVLKMIDVGGIDLIRNNNSNNKEGIKNGGNALHWFTSSWNTEVLMKIINIGGRDIVYEKSISGCNALPCAMSVEASYNVISKLIEIGGKDLIISKDEKGRNSLHYAVCAYHTSVEVMSMLIQFGGGVDLVLDQDESGQHSFHTACEIGASAEVLLRLIDIGGRDLVFLKDNYGLNALHYAVRSVIPSDEEPSRRLILKLIEVGGRDLVMDNNNHLGHNAIHFMGDLHYSNDGDLCFCQIDNTVLDILTAQGVGGAEILLQEESTGKTPLQSLVTQQFIEDWDQGECDPRIIENVSVLINKGIQLRIGGEYSIGGLLSSSTPDQEQVQDEIYQNWDKVVPPALEQVMAHPHNQHLPILQAVIINKVPPRIIKSTIQKFVKISVNTRDSVGQLPIDVAARHRISWNNGMKEIVEALLSTQDLSTQGSSTLFTMCIKNGLQWHDGMRVVVEAVDKDIIARDDDETGLYPFMLAGVGYSKCSYDLASIFHLIKQCPRLVRIYDENDVEDDDQFSRKRRRC